MNQEERFRCSETEDLFSEEDQIEVRKERRWLLAGLAICFGLIALVLLVAELRAEERTGPYPIQGVICDTKSQMIDFLTGYDGKNTRSMLHSINTDAGKTACGAVRAVVYIEERMEPFESEGGNYRLSRVSVVAFYIPGRGIVPVPGVTQYTAFPIEEKGEEA